MYILYYHETICETGNKLYLRGRRITVLWEECVKFSMSTDQRAALQMFEQRQSRSLVVWYTILSLVHNFREQNLYWCST